MSCQGDILVQTDVPPSQENEIGLNMNAIKKSFQVRSSSTFYNLTPNLSRTLSDFMYAQQNCSFQFQMII